MLIAIFYLAITVEGMTAALSAGRRNMDWVGVCLLACVTALGGGSVRDMLLGNYPLPWVANPHYLLVVIGAAAATIILARFLDRLKTAFLLLDALGLVTFTIIGCNVAIALEQPLLIVIVAGMITGCTGGVIRDVLCNEVPLLFRGELYASVSIITGVIYLAGEYTPLPHDAVTAIALVFGFALRALAIFRKWEMPRFVYTRDWH
ncbi:trimeric intracellular cation channel family protein [Cucumibacter marinus]|uniref:trimeric intracellular cation channel family protein n=1 Tax=Cucumibacter marinus TaxID=1121252 RepID=UPI00040A2E58|nr:trimeric intracellular cation channel family protein [Cucumibacter marinus]